MVILCLLAAGMLLSGCVHKQAKITETIYIDGYPSQSFDVKRSLAAFWGSKIEKSTGNLMYEGDGWRFSEGVEALGFDAGELTPEQLKAITKGIVEGITAAMGLPSP
jgi:hypothetical protein